MRKPNNKFNFKKRYLAATVPALLISACGGTSSSPENSGGGGNPGQVTFTITSPTEYPAGLSTPINASLTMTNTSNTNASAINYNVTTNTTGVVIDVSNGNTVCAVIPAHQSCSFIAVIPAGSSPGSFTVVATGNATNQSKLKNMLGSLEKTIGLKPTFVASVTTNIGLANIPPGSNSQLYILPANQTIIPSAAASTPVSISLVVESASPSFNSIVLFNNTTGQPINAIESPTPSGNYANESVVTFTFNLPAGVSTTPQIITALAQNGASIVGNSESANIFLAESGVGILNISPSNINLSNSYESQIYTLTNNGQADITGITLPNVTAPFNIINNTCSGTLAVNQSCNYTLIYTPNNAIGTQVFTTQYNNGRVNNESVSYTANLIGYANILLTSVSVLPGSVGIGTQDDPFYVESFSQNQEIIDVQAPHLLPFFVPHEMTLTYTNSGNSPAESFNVTPVLLSNGYSILQNNCSSFTLESSESNICTVRLKFQESIPQEEDLSLANTSLAVSWNDPRGSYTNQAINWTNGANNNIPQESVYLQIYPMPVITAYFSSTPDGLNPITNIGQESTFYLYYSMSGGYPSESYVMSPNIGIDGFIYTGGEQGEHCNVSVANSCYIGVNSSKASGGSSNTISFNNVFGGPVIRPNNIESITVVGTPYITLTANGFSGGGGIKSLAAGGSFVITATLTESGASVPTQVIESLSMTLNGNAYPGESFIFNPESCAVSSDNDICSITVQVGNNTESGNYNLNMQNSSGSVAVYGESIPFSVVHVTTNLIIFVTTNTHNGNFGGLAGANAFCNESTNQPAGLPISATYKALLAGNNSTIAGATYYQIGESIPIAVATGGDLVGESTSFVNEISSQPALVWVGPFIKSMSCASWESSQTSNRGSFGFATLKSSVASCAKKGNHQICRKNAWNFNSIVNKNGNTTTKIETGANCTSTMALYCVQQQ